MTFGDGGLRGRTAGRLASTLVVVAVLASAPAAAQTETLAESLFRDARVAMTDGDPARACPLFAESYRLDPAFGTLFNLGACEEKRGKLATAWAAFRRLVDVAPAGDERVIEANVRLTALEGRVPRLRIVVSQPLPPDHALQLDGVLLGPGAFEELLRVDPGVHTLRLIASGVEVRSSELELSEGETKTFEVEPIVPAPSVEPSAPPRLAAPPPRPRRPERGVPPRSRVPAYVALGLGGAGVGASLVLGGLALRARNVTDVHCPNLECDAEGMAAGDRGAKYASLATACAVAGLAGAVAGGWLLWRSSDRSVHVSVSGERVTMKGTF